VRLLQQPRQSRASEGKRAWVSHKRRGQTATDFNWWKNLYTYAKVAVRSGVVVRQMIRANSIVLAAYEGPVVIVKGR